MLKKTKLITGIALLVQSLTFLILFFVFFSRKKKSASAYLGISLATALSGAALIAWHHEDEKAENDLLWGDGGNKNEDILADDYNDEKDCIIEESDNEVVEEGTETTNE